MATKTTYAPEIVMKIWEIFPEAFTTAKKSPIIDRYNGQFGVEETISGYETIVLAECIAATANAISNGEREMDRALRYIESYKPTWVQRREINNFLKH